MKHTLLSTVAAVALLASAGTAFAGECQDVVLDSYGDPLTGIIGNACADESVGADGTVIFTPTGMKMIGIAETGAKPQADENGNYSTEGMVPTDKGEFTAFPRAEAYGENSTAVGNGARVGKYIPGKAQVGTAAYCNEGFFLTEDKTSCVNKKGVEKPKAFHEASDDYPPAVAPSSVPTNNGTALGANAVVEHDNSTAVGAGAKSTDSHQVTLGTKDDTIRAEGITSAKSKARQEGAIELVTSDVGGRLATDGGLTFDQISANSDLLVTHGAHLAKLDKGMAIAMAMPDLWLEQGKRFGVFGGVGGFGDETALGLGAIARVGDGFTLDTKFGADTSFKEFGWKVGAGYQW